MQFKDLLHKRILVSRKARSYGTEQIVEELKILEIAPSGNWIKVMDMNARKYWKHYSDITPIEVLAMVEKRPTEKP